MSTTTLTTTQVYRVYIKVTAEAIWTAITDPDLTDRYGYTGRAIYELRPGGRYWVNPGVEFKAEALLVSGTREEYGAGGGHAWVLNDLKTLLETGTAFPN